MPDSNNNTASNIAFSAPDIRDICDELEHLFRAYDSLTGFLPDSSNSLPVLYVLNNQFDAQISALNKLLGVSRGTV